MDVYYIANNPIGGVIVVLVITQVKMVVENVVTLSKMFI